MKDLIYHWNMFWLNMEYSRRLAKVSRERWKNCKLGTQFKQRQLVHSWAEGRRFEIYKAIYGV